MNCKICESPAKLIFKKKLLEKYQVDYFWCNNCGLVFTEKPYWLKEAYKSAITDSDIGLVARNLLLSKAVCLLIFFKFYQSGRKYLDYAGGYGLLVRLMRDMGFDYYWKDNYCNNLFAKNFELESLVVNDRKFELVTAFELFEHFVDPLEEINKMLGFGDSIFFTTNLCNFNSVEDIKKWWYISAETGQHIIFYTEKSLAILAHKYKMYFYTDGMGMHIFTKRRFIINPFTIIKPMITFFDFINNRSKGLQKDYESVVHSIKK